MAQSKGEVRRARRRRRHTGIRKKLRGTSERPRLVVYRSLRHMEGQLVDDDRGLTLAGISTRAAEVEERLPEEGKGKVARSFAAGLVLAERAREAGVHKVVFDRAGYRYHGRVRAFAEGARKGGLEF